MLSGVLFHEDSKCLLEGGLKLQKGVDSVILTPSLAAVAPLHLSYLFFPLLNFLLNLIYYDSLKNIWINYYYYYDVYSGTYSQALHGQRTGLIQEAKAATCQS